AAAIRSRGAWIPGLVDPAANGRSHTDGHRLTQAFGALGLDLQIINNPVESGILGVGQRMQAGRLKVFGSVTKYLHERRLYRRDERGQIVKERDYLQDAARSLISGISHLRTKPKPLSSRLAATPYPGQYGWML